MLPPTKMAPITSDWVLAGQAKAFMALITSDWVRSDYEASGILAKRPGLLDTQPEIADEALQYLQQVRHPGSKIQRTPAHAHRRRGLYIG